MPRSHIYDDWYDKLKATRRTQRDGHRSWETVHPSDFTSAMETALRRRAKNDGLGLSVRSHPPNGILVSLFTKGTGPRPRVDRVEDQATADMRLVAKTTDILGQIRTVRRQLQKLQAELKARENGDGWLYDVTLTVMVGMTLPPDHPELRQAALANAVDYVLQNHESMDVGLHLGSVTHVPY